MNNYPDGYVEVTRTSPISGHVQSIHVSPVVLERYLKTGYSRAGGAAKAPKREAAADTNTKTEKPAK